MAGEAGASDFEGEVFRHTSPLHAEISLSLLAHTERTGYRFNPPGEFGAIYLALDRDTAVRELRRLAAYHNLPVSALMPRKLIIARVRLQRVLNLCTEEGRQAHAVTREELESPDWSACQAVARRARSHGYEAIHYPSATGAGENLALFLDRLRRDSYVRILRIEELTADLP
jgi:RES domain-containing protein